MRFFQNVAFRLSNDDTEEINVAERKEQDEYTDAYTVGNGMTVLIPASGSFTVPLPVAAAKFLYVECNKAVNVQFGGGVISLAPQVSSVDPSVSLPALLYMFASGVLSVVLNNPDAANSISVFIAVAG